MESRGEKLAVRRQKRLRNRVFLTITWHRQYLWRKVKSLRAGTRTLVSGSCQLDWDCSSVASRQLGAGCGRRTTKNSHSSWAARRSLTECNHAGQLKKKSSKCDIRLSSQIDLLWFLDKMSSASHQAPRVLSRIRRWSPLNQSGFVLIAAIQTCSKDKSSSVRAW